MRSPCSILFEVGKHVKPDLELVGLWRILTTATTMKSWRSKGLFSYAPVVYSLLLLLLLQLLLLLAAAVPLLLLYDDAEIFRFF